MSSWYAQYLLAGERIRDRRDEAERRRLAGAFAGRDHVSPVSSGPLRRHERSPLPAVTAARVRCWTLRLARLAVTISLDPEARPEVRS